MRLTLPSLPHAIFSDAATLHEFFILSELHIDMKPEAEAVAVVEESSHAKCARCWKHLPEVGSFEAHPTLCGRCNDAVGS